MKIAAMFLVVLAAGISACSNAPSSPAEPDILAGPIPDCPELMSPSRQAYQKAAEEQCKAAVTMQERMNTKGCEIIQRVDGCPLNAKP